MRLYELHDMVKVGCQDCAGCSACCQGMGDTVILDPLDAYRLTGRLHKSFAELLQESVALHVEEGLILPHLRMTGSGERCFYLNEEGRCIIHAFRPGLCRTFPLGRNYEEGKLTYFLVEGECAKENRTKVKVSKWIDTPDIKENQAFLIRWHYLLKRLRKKAARMAESAQASGEEGQESLKAMNLLVLQVFFMRPYDSNIDFYSQFEERVKEMEESLSI